MNARNSDIPDLSLRHLKAMLKVCQYKNLTRAANKLNRSQTAITKAISDLEDNLGVTLFDRSSIGMSPTIYGDTLALRVAQVEREFQAAGEAYMDYKKTDRGYQTIPIFSMDISYKRLASFLALYETKDISSAAKKLSITRAAIYNSIRQLEELLDLPLFEREPNGVRSTAFCAVLARHIKLAFSQIRHAIDDIASIDGITVGRVALGTLPYTRTILTPRAITHLLNDHPQLDISTFEGSYAVLESALRSGDLDFIVGAIRADNASKDLITEKLFEDNLSVIARVGHPLKNKSKLTLADLQDYDWILPSHNTPTRKLFDETLRSHDLEPPEHAIETSSLSTVRGLLLESDRLALLSEHQIYYDKEYGVLEALPIKLKETHRPIGVTMRAHTKPSPAAELFLNSLRAVAKNLTP